MKKFLIIGSIVLVAFVGFILFRGQDNNQAASQQQTNPSSNQSDVASSNETNDLNAIKNGVLRVIPEESTVKWSAQKVLVRTNDHFGTVKIKSGSLNLEEGELVGGKFVIDMTSISTEDLEGSRKESLDRHLKSEDFFDVENNSEAIFTITEVKKTETLGEYMLVGDLTIKGKTNQIEILATVQQTNKALTMSSDFSIDRTLWDIRYDSGKFFQNLGNNVIDDNIGFSVMVVAR